MAGVREVVASRWAVDSSATRDLMLHFYRELCGGKPPALALGLAERAVRLNGTTNHPYFWAAFSLFGTQDGPLKLVQQRTTSAQGT